MFLYVRTYFKRIGNDYMLLIFMLLKIHINIYFHIYHYISTHLYSHYFSYVSKFLCRFNFAFFFSNSFHVALFNLHEYALSIGKQKIVKNRKILLFIGIIIVCTVWTVRSTNNSSKTFILFFDHLIQTTT